MFFRIAMLAAALALSACSVFHESNVSSTAAGEASVVEEGPPTVDGVYTYPDCEGEGGCSYRNWRTMQPTPLLAEHSRRAAAIGTLPSGEWVHVEELATRLVPRRGVVREDTSDLHAGEVVYALEYEGEGFLAIWRRGERASVGYEEQPAIEWDEGRASVADLESLGTWARVKRENGQAGWVRLEDGHFECLGSLAGDPDCRD